MVCTWISLLSVGAVRRGRGWLGNCNLSFSINSVVDLAQIENSSLHRPAGSQAMVLDDTEVVMILAVFFAIVAAQTPGLHSTVFQRATMKTHALTTNNRPRKPQNVRNCESRASTGEPILNTGLAMLPLRRSFARAVPILTSTKGWPSFLGILRRLSL
jgi:hypothetical protein